MRSHDNGCVRRNHRHNELGCGSHDEGRGANGAASDLEGATDIESPTHGEPEPKRDHDGAVQGDGANDATRAGESESCRGCHGDGAVDESEEIGVDVGLDGVLLVTRAEDSGGGERGPSVRDNVCAQRAVLVVAVVGDGDG
eukprot:Amastigsp_a181275_21.p5 type:complete len:141 gc:universal Amastigsp_a181275_21:513-935(+)